MHVTQLKSYYTHYKLTFPAKPNIKHSLCFSLHYKLYTINKRNTHTRSKSAPIKQKNIHFLSSCCWWWWCCFDILHSPHFIYLSLAQTANQFKIAFYFQYENISCMLFCRCVLNALKWPIYIAVFFRAACSLVRFPLALVFFCNATYSMLLASCCLYVLC